jgi:hypothetical protein
MISNRLVHRTLNEILIIDEWRRWQQETKIGDSM